MQLIKDRNGYYYLVDENTRTEQDNLVQLIENNIEPTILDEDEFVQGPDDTNLVIPKGQKVYYADDIWLDFGSLEDLTSVFSDNNLNIKYPLLVKYSVTGTWWITGPVDFDNYRRQMRDIMFRYSKSVPAFVETNEGIYIGILKPGLSILHDTFGEEADLNPILYEEEPTYETNLPIYEVLKDPSEPFPLYLTKDRYGVVIQLIPDRKIDAIIWVSGIVPYPKSTNTIAEIFKELGPYIKNPAAQQLYQSDVDVYYE